MEVDEITVPVRINTVVGKELMDDWQSEIYLRLKDFCAVKKDNASVTISLDPAAAYIVTKMIETSFELDKSIRVNPA